VAEWRWECVTDDLLDGLPPDALRAVQQLAKELAVRESMVFHPALRLPQRRRADLRQPPRTRKPASRGHVVPGKLVRVFSARPGTC
jgi:hypothetical protein